MMITFKKNGIELIDPAWNALKAEISMETENITRKLGEDFGQMAQGYSLTINFTSTGGPLTQVDSTLMMTTIHLPEYAMHSDDNSKYQRKLNLSHELVHTLTPNGNSDRVTFFEEGLATYFSEEYTGYSSGAPSNYATACNLVAQLLKIDRSIVRKLRARYPEKKISEFTADDLLGELFPAAFSLAQSLARPFYAA